MHTSIGFIKFAQQEQMREILPKIVGKKSFGHSALG
jgi:hypothetical protein